MRRVALLIIVLTAAWSVPGTGVAGAAGQIAPPVGTGSLHIRGPMRDGGTVTAAGVAWRPGRLPHGDRLLSFEVAYTWQACLAGTCRTAADTTSTPFAARRHVVGHADTGRVLRLTETATEVVETDPATFAFSVAHASRTVLAVRPVRALCRRAGALERVRERHAGAAHRVEFRVVRRLAASLPRSGRSPGRHLPHRRPRMASPARQARRLHRPARPGPAPRVGAHRRRCRHDRALVPLACRAPARAGRLRPPPRPRMLVSAAPRPHRPADALGLADRPGDTASSARAQAPSISTTSTAS